MSIQANQISNAGGLAGYNPSYVWGGAPSWMQTGAAGENAAGWTTGTSGQAGGIDPADQLSAVGTQFGTQNLGNQTIDPTTMAAIQQMGWTGGNPIVNTGGANGLSPQFQQFLTQNGLTAGQFALPDSGGNNQAGFGIYNGSSTSPTTGQVGDTSVQNYGNDQGFM